MACMCGDLRCGSCGPAQGNHHCQICGAWTDEGGCEKPDECNEKMRLEAEAEAAYYAGLYAQEESDRQYWQAIDEENSRG